LRVLLREQELQQELLRVLQQERELHLQLLKRL
jgi:hypothetical protein